MKRGEQSKPLKIVHAEVCGPVKVVIRGRYNEYWKWFRNALQWEKWGSHVVEMNKSSKSPLFDYGENIEEREE